MKRLAFASLFLLSFLMGCGTSTAPVTTSSVRKYNGTASVGDFLTISIDSTVHTIDYINHTNGDSGTVPYTVNVDGTYTVTDPQGNILAAYEVPGFVLLVETAKSGPTHNTPALITAIELCQRRSPICLGRTSTTCNCAPPLAGWKLVPFLSTLREIFNTNPSALLRS